MFERFTLRARMSMSRSRAEAIRLGSGSIGTEHILLGILQTAPGVATQVLERLGVNLDLLRKATEAGAAAIPGPHPGPIPGQVPFTEGAKEAIEASGWEGSRMEMDVIGTQHFLLGLLRDDGLAGRLLKEQGLTADRVREEAAKIVDEEGGSFVWPPPQG